jgi:hypothetical protein
MWYLEFSAHLPLTATHVGDVAFDSIPNHNSSVELSVEGDHRPPRLLSLESGNSGQDFNWSREDAIIAGLVGRRALREVACLWTTY